MTVAHLWYDQKIVDSNITEIFEGSEFNIALLLCAALCNSSDFKGQEKVQTLKKDVIGSATEAALLRFTDIVYGSIGPVRNAYLKLLKYHSTRLKNIKY